MGPQKRYLFRMFSFPFHYWRNKRISSWSVEIQVDGYRRNRKSWTGSGRDDGTFHCRP